MESAMKLTPAMVLSGMEDKVDEVAVDFMLKAIPEDPHGGLLIRQMISFTATYDHIVDGDEFTVNQVHGMVDILLRGLIQNPFYINNVNLYVPIIINAIHAWRYADDCPEYRVKVGDVLSELGCAMLYLSGGMMRLNEFGGGWRDQVLRILKDSDKQED